MNISPRLSSTLDSLERRFFLKEALASARENIALSLTLSHFQIISHHEYQLERVQLAKSRTNEATYFVLSFRVRRSGIELEADAFVFIEESSHALTLFSSSHGSFSKPKLLDITRTLLLTRTDELKSQPSARPEIESPVASSAFARRTSEEACDKASRCDLLSKPRRLTHALTRTSRSITK